MALSAMLPALVATQLATLAAATCRSVYPQDGFTKAPWAQLAKSVSVQTLVKPDMSAMASGSPLRITDTPATTFYSGAMGSPSVPGWAASNSTPAKAVTLRNAADAAIAVKFATANGLEISIKSTGHDWFGRSARPGTLLLWTHKMTGMVWHDSFTPSGCTAGIGAAVTVDAGVQFWQYYTEAMKRNLLVVGGTCSTVGHVGFTLGGGYGDFSNMYGSGATNLVEAEVVLADGTTVTANACNAYSDLFRALRGGGGAFGLVTKATYKTYPYPTGKIGQAFGVLKGRLAGAKRFLAWYAGMVKKDKIQHFGGQVTIGGWAGDSLNLQMKYVGITAQECTALCTDLGVTCRDGGRVWPPGGAKINPGGMPGWQQPWEERASGAYHAGTLLRYIAPAQLGSALAASLVDAAKTQEIMLTLNYALGSASKSVAADAKGTSVHPQVYTAVLAVKVEMLDRATSPATGTPVNPTFLNRFQGIRAKLDSALPGAGSYYNEGDYTDEAWQQRYWGSNYKDLLKTKAKYDPDNLFTCHQCVGSEGVSTSSCGARRLRSRDDAPLLV